MCITTTINHNSLPQVEITTDNIGATPKRSEVPLLAEFAKKRARASTPGLTVQDHVQTVTGTPRTERMARLIPGCEEDRSLTALLAKLVKVANHSMQLPAKGRLAKQVHIDVDSCADILVLISAAYDQHEFDKTKRTLFQRPASALAGSTRAAAPIMNPTSSSSNQNFDFQTNSMTEKLEVLSEQVAILTSHIMTDKPTRRANANATGSYAAAASKHAGNQQQGQNSGPKINKAAPKPQARKRLANTVTLVQTDKSKVALGDLSVTQLIQGFNMAFKANSIKTDA
ncbi:hypothetical protein DFH28DRAFT_936557 [Melampsora americana]|nr:hypothetical protein DFH28DRAFT_936557 [Melampsora americana]